MAAGAGNVAADAVRLLGSEGGLLQTHNTRPQVLVTILRELERLFRAAACPAGMTQCDLCWITVLSMRLSTGVHCISVLQAT